MDALVAGAAALGQPLTREQVALFARYEAVLLDWNTRVNLTAIVDPAAIRRRHFLDSLTCIQVTGDLDGQRVIDVGAGAGFPGLPLKICFPTMRLTLVESVAKKSRFLAAVIGELALDDIQVVTGRAETLGQDEAYRERYDWAVARAVAPLPVLAEYLLPLCRIGGRMLAQKGSAAAAEAEAAARAVARLGGGDLAVHAVRMPGLEATMHLVSAKKVAPTPAAYPRRPGVPSRRPLA